MRKGLKRSAFTLIEMSVVVAVIGVLYTTVMPMYGKTIQRSKEAALKKDLHVFRQMLNDYYKDNEKWPESLNTLVEKGYIREVPPDPITEKTDTWVTVPSEPGLNDVYDVKSGADGTGLDGKKYGEF